MFENPLLQLYILTFGAYILGMFASYKNSNVQIELTEYVFIFAVLAGVGYYLLRSN